MENIKKSASFGENESTSIGKIVSTDNSIRQSVENQDEDINKGAFMDLVELDPVEPENSKDIKGRDWCFVLYPESAPENWLEILNTSGLAWSVSPLHQHDLNPDASRKKEHYHVIIIWGNSTTYAAVKKFTKGVLNATVPQLLHSPVGYYRYFTHKDNPEKHPYDETEIMSGNGFDIADYAKMTKQQKLELHMKISRMILDNGIGRYDQAVEICMGMGFDEYEMLTTHTIHFMSLCKSVQYSNAQCFKNSNREVK